MKIFAYIDANGIPVRGGRNRELPDGAVELTPPLNIEDLPHIRFRDGAWERRPEEQPFVLSPEEVAAEQAAMAAAQLTRARTQLVERVNRMAGDLRRRIYTDIPGQDALYLEKRAEALAYVAATLAQGGTEPALLDAYPLLASEVGITAPSAWQLAQLWLNRSDQFKRVGAATEQARMRAIAAIATAPDFTSLEAIEADFTEGLSRLPL